jgi:sugar/nucleoside kinase (ribokinase family)
MASLLVVGSIAFDSVETPHDSRENVIGGSAVFCSYAASYFTNVLLVGVVGEDWPEDFRQILASRPIDLSGLRVERGKRTFRWRGKYHENMNNRETLEVQLNVFEEFDPHVPEGFRDARFVFLANGVPAVQQKVLSQVRNPEFVMCDTMDLWIVEHRPDLLKVLKQIHGIVLNNEEAQLLSGEENLVLAGRAIRMMGPQMVVVKKGEHGTLFFTPDQTFALPAYPVENLTDPTGAGDSFAGGAMGYLSALEKVNMHSLRQAIAYGTVVASFNVEDFSLDRMRTIERQDIEARLGEFRDMLRI